MQFKILRYNNKNKYKQHSRTTLVLHVSLFDLGNDLWSKLVQYSQAIVNYYWL